MPFDLFTRHDGFEALRLLLAAASLIVACGYMAIEAQPANGLRTTFKTFSILLLAPLPLFLLSTGPEWTLLALSLALVCGSAGDYFLALKGEAVNFKRGIIAFLIGHLFYLAVMLPRLVMPTPLQMAGMVLLAIMAIGVCWHLSPKLGAYKKPIWAYMGVIALMALAALAMPSPLTGVGALLFVFSDAVIVMHQFGRPVPYRGPIVWVTYYAGQVLLAGSLLTLLG
tara:strand:+ start:201778 stop:202455 length:678 start_codon:yes stop_codon:yes gene_type:complete